MKLIKRGFILTLFLTISYLTVYRFFYGILNPFVVPDRIRSYERSYFVSGNSPIVLTENDKPNFPIYSINTLLGKRLYSKYPKGEFVPTVIYLYIGKDEYQVYELSGGP